MLYPNKHTRFEESILYKMLFILELNELKEIKIISLYDILKKNTKTSMNLFTQLMCCILLI